VDAYYYVRHSGETRWHVIHTRYSGSAGESLRECQDGRDQMADKGARKIFRKSRNMARAYERSKARAVDGYEDTPFSQEMKSNYADAMRGARFVAPDPTAWAENWKESVR
jgi:hypothetical protein